MLWDFKPGKAPARKQVESAVKANSKELRKMKTTERMMPFYRCDGPLLRVKDGSTVTFLTYPGDNLALRDDRQKAEYAARNAAVLSGCTAEAMGIWVFPTAVSAKQNLIKCDERIREEQETLNRLGDSPEAEPHRRSLELLTQCVRPQLERSTASSTEIVYSTYIGLKFSTAGDREIENSVSNFAQAFSKLVGKRMDRLGEYEVYDLIEQYMKGHAPLHRSMGPKVIMPAAAEER